MRKGLNALQLKIIACVSMFIDHFTYAVLDIGKHGIYDLFGTGIAEEAFYTGIYRVIRVGRIIGRTAFPIFAFLIAEGFFRTKSRAKYMGRLLVFALISEYPFDHAIYPNRNPSYACNVYFTLALGLAAIWISDLLREKALLPLAEKVPERRGMILGPLRFVSAGAVCCVVGAVARHFHTDYGFYGVAAITAFYLLREYMDLAGIFALSILCVHNTLEIWGFPGILAARAYNGEKGRQSRWFFYVFYPAHIMALYLLRKKLFGF